MREEGNNFEFIFPSPLSCSSPFFPVLQAQAVEVFPKQRLGTNSVNVQGEPG